MCDFDNSTVASFQSQFNIFSPKPITANSSCINDAKQDTKELLEIIKKRGKRGFGTSSARFVSEVEIVPGPGSYVSQDQNIKNMTSKCGFGIGKRQLFGKNNISNVPYYLSEQKYSSFKSQSAKQTKHRVQYFLTRQHSKRQQVQTPGPGYYNPKTKVNSSPTYRHLFKPNISQSQTIQKEPLPVIQQMTRPTYYSKAKKVIKKKQQQTRQYFTKITQQNLIDVQSHAPNLLKQDLVFIHKNTNEFIEKNINLYGSHFKENNNPAPNAYRIKIPFAKSTGFKFSKSPNRSIGA